MRYTIREVPPTGTASPGNVLNFDLQSILNEFRAWSFPCIHSMSFRYTPTFTTGAAGGVPRTLPLAFASNILIQDVGGQRCNLRGSSLNNLLKSEWGLSYVQPAATPAGAGPTTITTYYPVPIMPPKTRRKRDFSLPVTTFLDGGVVQLTVGPAEPFVGGYNVSAADYRLELLIVEEGVPELKSRFLLRDQEIAQTDFAGYIVGGFCRSAYWYNGERNELSATPWPVQRIDSYTLNYQQVRDDALRHLHLMESQTFRPDSGSPAAASVIVNEDPTFTGQMLPIIWPRRDGKTTDLIQMSTLHVRTNLGAITATDLPKLITTTLEERNPVASQRTLKRSDVSAALKASGRVKTANGNKKGIDQFPIDLVNVLPVKIEAGK